MFTTRTETSSLSEWSDRELVSWIINDAQTLELRMGQEELYQRYADKIYYKCLSLIKDENTAKDLTHDIFIKIFVHLSRYKHEAPFYSWVFAITYNYCFDHLKKQKKYHQVEISEVPNALVVDDTLLQYKLFKEAKLAAMEEAFNHLKAPERLILSMYYQDKMSIKSISVLLDAGESAVKMRLKRSREHLAELIKKVSDE